MEPCTVPKHFLSVLISCSSAFSSFYLKAFFFVFTSLNPQLQTFIYNLFQLTKYFHLLSHSQILSFN